MSDAEVAALATAPDLDALLALRTADDDAKVVGASARPPRHLGPPPPPLSSFRGV